MVEIVHIIKPEWGTIAYFKGSEYDDMGMEPYPTFRPDGSLPAIYDYVNNVMFGGQADIRDRDLMNTLNVSDPNIVEYTWDIFEHDNYAVYLQAIVMSDGSRWFDLTGDGRPETHVKIVGGVLAYDSDLNGTFDMAF